MNKTNIQKILFFLLLPVTLVFPQKQIYYDISLENGLTNKVIYALAQDYNGVLLVGTNDGMAYFDGSAFVMENYEPLRDVTIASFYVDQDSTLYVGTIRGFAVFGRDSIKYISDFNGKTFLVFSFYENIDRILLSTSTGVLAYKNDKLFEPNEFSFLSGKRVYEIEYFNGNYFIATKSGLYILNIKTAQWERLLPQRTFGIEIDKHGEVWFSTAKGIYTYKNGELKLFSDKLKSVNRMSVLVYNKHKDLFAFKNYKNDMSSEDENQIVFIKDKKIINRFTDFDFLPDGALYFDMDDALWLTSSDGHLIKYLSIEISHFERHYGVKSNPFGIMQRSDGTILLATDGQGVLKYTGKDFKPFLKTLPNTAWQIYEDSQNRLWITTSDGIFYLDGNDKLHELKDNQNKSLYYGSALYEDHNGRIWFGSEEGIYSYKDGVLKKHFTITAVNEMLYTILPADSGKYWLCFNDRIKKFDGEKFLPYKYEEELDHFIYSTMQPTPDGKYALATYSGVVFFDENASSADEAIRRLSINDGLISDRVFWLIFDGHENLWIMTAGGLSVLNYVEFISSGKMLLTNFGHGDPVIGDEYNQLSALLDNTGGLWLGTVSGVLHIPHPENVIFRKQILRPYLKEIQVMLNNGERKIIRGRKPGEKLSRLDLKYNENSVFLNLSAVSFTNNSLLTYRYDNQIHGEKKAFSSTNSIYVIDLPPGEHIFGVEVKDQFGNIRRCDNLLNLYIQVPFWKTNWFYSLLVVTVALIIFLFVIIRERGLKKRNDELRKLIEEKDKLAEELRKTSNEYQALFDNAFTPMIILSIDDFKIIEANEAASKLFQYTIMDFRNLSFENLFEISKKSFKNHYQFFRRTKNEYYGFSSRMKTAAGNVIETEINGKVIQYKGDEAIILAIKDVTKERQLEENLKRSMENREKSEKIKANFLAQMSHEIRTPLSSITSFVSLLRAELGDMSESIREEYDYIVNGIVKSSRRIIRTVDLMLNKSQLDANDYKPVMRKVDIVKMTKTLLGEFVEIAEAQGIKLNLIFDEKHIWIFGDEYALEQIIGNIVDNAIKYTPKGEVKIVLKSQDDKVIVEIIDTGIGIKKEYLPHLFDAFSQEEDGYTRKFDGNGLGLSVVKHFCDLIDCEIEVESEKGKGSTFRLIIKKKPNL